MPVQLSPICYNTHMLRKLLVTIISFGVATAAVGASFNPPDIKLPRILSQTIPDALSSIQISIKNSVTSFIADSSPSHIVITETDTPPSETGTPASTETATSTPAKPIGATAPATQKNPQKKPIASKPVGIQATTTPATPTPEITEIIPNFDAINTAARKALVNIICTTKSGGSLSPITGSGVVIDPRGIILTNAHIGEYWLLENFSTPGFIDCTIRTGSPAYPRYKAELIYISQNWIKENKTLLKESNPKGTGENDYALLRITKNADGTALQAASFPFMNPNTREAISEKEPVALVSYPAGFLGGLSILQDLNLTSALTNIQDVFTFKENTIDLISVPGTVVSQKGASGGGVFDAFGTLLGIISTSSDGNTTSERDLRAITLGHVSRSLKSETGKDLRDFLNHDLAVVADNFQKNIAPVLTKLITDELVK